MASIHGAIPFGTSAGVGEADRCRVCGSSDLQTDEVSLRGRLLLAACGHCDDRWTQRLPDAAPHGAPAPRRADAAERDRDAEVATAA